MKKVILSLVFVFGMVTVGNAGNKVVSNDVISFEYSKNRADINKNHTLLYEYLTKDNSDLLLISEELMIKNNTDLYNRTFSQAEYIRVGLCGKLAGLVGNLLRKSGAISETAIIMTEMLIEQLCKELIIKLL
jgi:hypothetical protein